MKPRIGAYLSKRTAAKLAATAKHRGATKSALVETALNRFLGFEDVDDAATLTGRLVDLSDQIAQLDRSLGIVSEIVALHARFHLAVSPELPAATQHSACERGSARFDEFAAQVERRMQQGTPLMQETLDRLGTSPSGARGKGGPPSVGSAAYGSDLSASASLDEIPEDVAAAREGGSIDNFRAQSRGPTH
jgi:hypothetical protein